MVCASVQSTVERQGRACCVVMAGYVGFTLLCIFLALHEGCSGC